MSERFVRQNDGAWLNMRYVLRIRARDDGSGNQFIEAQIFNPGGSENLVWVILHGNDADLTAAQKRADALTQGFDPIGLIP